jgi:chromosome segregation ATPase
MPPIPRSTNGPDDDLRGRIKELDAERRDLQGKLDDVRGQLTDAQTQRATLQAASEQLQARLTESDTKLGEAQQGLSQAQDQLRANAEELGRLRAVSQNVDGLQQELTSVRAERDELQKQLADSAATLDTRVAQQVLAAVEQVRKEHEAAAAEWEQERKQLQDRIDALTKGAGEGQALQTRDLAVQFRSVLEELAEPEQSGGAAAAALTNLEVEARGMLAPPTEGETLPRLVPVSPEHAVDPGALSTVRLRFGLLPRLPTEGDSQ